MVKLKVFYLFLKFYIDLFIGRSLFATDILPTVFDINFLKLKSDYDLVIFDFDDTLAGYHDKLGEKSRKLLKELVDLGFKVAIYSNSPRKRIKKDLDFFAELKLFVSYTKNKPNPKGYFEIMQEFDINPNRTVMVGDMPITDMYGAYLAGIKKRILVHPYSEILSGHKSPFPFSLVRAQERNSCSKLIGREKRL
ncbi:HAD-IIIA family hydrolase [Candidatus Dojkabacteria bacterium]|nr:HAD-IIIA family hydrolase [Candidatus Dojkabacteria bacterium]